MPSKSLFPQSCGSSVIKSHWPSKLNSLGVSQSICQIPGLGNSLWALEVLQQCKNFFGIIILQFVDHLLGGSMVGLMLTFSKRTYATHHTFQVCCSQSSSPCSKSLLTCASAGDAHTLKGRSGSVSCGGHCSFPWVLVRTRFCLCPPSISGRCEIWFDSKCNFTPPTVLLRSLLCPWTRGIFF